MSTPAIDCQKLSKQYGNRGNYALRGLTIHVNAGEIYGFLGPNGAGKSTAIRTLLNFIQPSGGSASILGYDIVRDSLEAKKHVGYLAGDVALYDHMTGQQFLDYMAELQPLRDPNYLGDLTVAFKAELTKPIKALSKGNRQKLGIIQAFMHQPEVLILDEPTSGLDPLMQAVFYQTAEDAKKRGAAIFLSSHDLTEVRKMCDRIGFIRGGVLITEKTIADLQQTAAHNFDITFKDKAPLAELKKLPDAKVHAINAHIVSARFQGDLTPLFKVLAKHTVLALDRQELDLEEEFMSLYQPGTVEKKS